MLCNCTELVPCWCLGSEPGVMWGTVSWPWTGDWEFLEGSGPQLFFKKSFLNITYQKINDLMGWNYCRMDAAALLHFLRKLPALFCLLFCLWLVQCYQHAESSGHTVMGKVDGLQVTCTWLICFHQIFEAGHGTVCNYFDWLLVCFISALFWKVLGT